MKNSDIVIAYVTFCASVAIWRYCRRLKSTEKLTGTSAVHDCSSAVLQACIHCAQCTLVDPLHAPLSFLLFFE